MKFVYIFEDGQCFKSNNKPSKGDLDAIEDGLLQVLCFEDNDVKEYDGEGYLISLDSIKNLEDL